MRWKRPSTTVTLTFVGAAIAAVVALDWIIGEAGAKRSSRCIRINAFRSAVFGDDATWLATLSRINSGGEHIPTAQTILICDAEDGHEQLKLEKVGQLFCELFPVNGKDQLVSLSIDQKLGLQSKLQLTYWNSTAWRELHSATLDPDFRFRGEHRFVLSPGGERFYLISELSPVQRKNMPPQLQSAGSLTCWNLPNANKQFVISDDAAPQPRLRSLVFTGDGSMMAAICASRTITVWDAVAGKELHRFAEVGARQLAVNMDGTVLVAGTREKVRCWNLLTGREGASVNLNVPKSEDKGRLEGDTATAVGPSIVLSSNGRHLAVCSGRREIETWDVAKGSRTGHYKLDEKVAAGIADMAFSPDGTRLAAVGREFIGTSFEWRNYDAHIYVWEVSSGQLVHHSTLARAFGRGPHHLVFRRDGHRLIVVSEQCITLCSLGPEKP